MQDYLELLLDLLAPMGEAEEPQAEINGNLLERRLAVPAAGSELHAPEADQTATSLPDPPDFGSDADWLPEREGGSADRSAVRNPVHLPQPARIAGGTENSSPEIRAQNAAPEDSAPLPGPDTPAESDGPEDPEDMGRSPMTLAVQLQKSWRRSTGRGSGEAGTQQQGSDLHLPAGAVEANPTQWGNGTSEHTALQSQTQAARRAAGYRLIPSGGGTGLDRAGLVPRQEILSAPAPDLLAVDRAFERDARRYDAGFTLY